MSPRMYPRILKVVRPGGTAVDAKTHWERVYSSKRSDEVSWYQASPTPSLRMLERAGLRPDT